MYANTLKSEKIQNSSGLKTLTKESQSVSWEDWPPQTALPDTAYLGPLSHCQGVHLLVSKNLQPLRLNLFIEWQPLFYPGIAREDEFLLLPDFLLEFNGQGLLHGQLSDESHHLFRSGFDPPLIAVHLESKSPRLS